MPKLRKATGVREISPGVFEIYASAGRDPLSGKYRQVSRYFYGSFRDAKVERASLVLEVSAGKYSPRRTAVDELVVDWLKELRRKGRSMTTIDEYERCYYRDIQPAIGSVDVSKVTTKMLTDLYAAHQDRGAAPLTVRKVHTIASSIMSQACRWGLRNDNPAHWADPPANTPVPIVVPTPEEVLRLIEGAKQSSRPVYAKVIFLAATTGLRRGELCALRVGDIDWEQSAIRVERSIQARRRKLEPGESRKVEGPTKNRRRRIVAVDGRSFGILREQVEAVRQRAADHGEKVIKNHYVFTDSLDGAEGWHPDAITRYFSRLRRRLALQHITVKSLRAFMDTYGNDLGFSVSQVALRAGHDPAVASRHYLARVDTTDHALAEALADLVAGSSREVDDVAGNQMSSPEFS